MDRCNSNASGRSTGVFYLKRIAPDLPRLKSLLLQHAERRGVHVLSPQCTEDKNTISEFIALYDGRRPPGVALKLVESSVYTLLSSGAPTSIICKLILQHALGGCKDDVSKHEVTKLVAECDMKISESCSKLVLPKILQLYMTQIAKYSSSV